MEDLRKIDDVNYTPIKGDTVYLNNRCGCLLDDNFNQIVWVNTEEIEDWIGGWSEFINAGGYILSI